jgi:hypothetical protein
VNTLLHTLGWLVGIAGAAWVFALFLQLADAAGSLDRLRSARDLALKNGPSRKRIYENIWSLAGGAALALLLGFGVDVAVRLVFDWGQLFAGIVLMLGLLVIALFGALVIVAFMLRGEGLSYAVLRANLLDEAESRPTSEQVRSFRTQLEQIDGRKRHIRFGLRNRAGLAPVRARLESIAAEFAAVPPTGFGAIRPVRWKTANAYLWVGNPLRLIPALLGVIMLAALVVGAAIFGTDSFVLVLILLAIVATALSFLLAIFESRVALAAKAAWHAVYQKQRLDALRLLEDLERSSRKGVSGLGDRVTRALQILRDQQS